MSQSVLLSSAYLAPIEYYQAIAQNDATIIEQYDHFEKQTYRSRCRILTCNQVMDLVVPIIRPKERCPFKEIKISYTEKWQQTHWRAIESAYNKSPFFEYYKEDYEPFFTKKYDYLIDLNQGLLETTMQLIHLYTPLSLSKTYQKEEELVGITDMRRSFHPKQIHTKTNKPYYQVFDQKFGFQPHLSIIDLLFNMGPETILYLK
ncbi:MAG: WbqC family protein [Paludibacteraceae bacterium]|nr:WbqC family protein [Paludibacteraceae bacterium]